MKTPKEYIDVLIQMLEEVPGNEFVFSTKTNIENFNIEDLKQIAFDQGYIFSEAKDLKNIKLPKYTKQNCYVLYKASWFNSLWGVFSFPKTYF